MRILVAHNFYSALQPSGEATAFASDIRLLRAHGYEVIEYSRSNDELARAGALNFAAAGMQSVWSRRTYTELTRVLAEHKPDVAHFHNVFPLISVSAYQACRRARVPVVQTVHNYRHSCLNGLFIRDGVICESCLGKSSVRGVVHRCYRGSLAASALAAVVRDAQRYMLRSNDNVDVFIALTQFAAAKLIESGIAPGRIAVRANFLEDEAPSPSSVRGDYVLYAGRLAPEKGVRTLILAWHGIRTTELVIAGEGPQRGELETLAHSLDVNARFIGLRSRREVLDLAAHAKCQVVPSEWYEGFPMTIVEAFSRGTPVIASRIGGLAEMVEHHGAGVMFSPGDSEALHHALLRLLNEESTRVTCGTAAWNAYVQKYSARPAIEALSAIYRRVVS